MLNRSVFKTLVLVASACAIASGAYAANSGVTYQGRILKPDGTPLSGANTLFKLQLRTPDGQNCLMYEEIQLLDLRNSNGVFNLTMNDGSGSRTDTTGFALDQVFANHGTLAFNLSTCSAGPGSYTPNSTDGRTLAVLFKDETMATWEPVPAQRINFVPFAFEAKQIAGFTPQSLVRVAEADGTLDFVSPLSNANYTELLNLIGGTSAQYAKQSAGAGTVVSSGAGNVATPSAGSVWLDTTGGNLKFYDGTTVKTVGTSGGSVSSVATGVGLTGGPITTSGTIALATLGAGGTGYKVTYDTYGRVTAAVALVEADIPTLSTAGHVIGSAITSGTIGGTTAINTSGSITTTGALSSGAITSSGLITSPSLTSTAIGTQSVQVFETTNSYKVTIQAPAALSANYALTLPTTAGSPSQVLTTNGSGVLTWTTPSGTGISALTGDVTASGTGSVGATVATVGGSSAAAVNTGTVAANAATNLNTGSTIVKRDSSGNFTAGTVTVTAVSASGAVTQGSSVYKDTGANTVTVSAPTSVTASYAMKWPLAIAGTTGQVLSSDTSGNLSWLTPASSLPPNGAAGGDLSGSYPNPAVATVGASSAANIHSGEVLANAATNLNTGSAIVKRDSSGNFVAGYVTANQLILNNAGSLFNIVNPIGGAWTMTMPATAGSSGQVMTTNGPGGLMSWTTPLSSSTAFINGGNSFSANASLGTSDNFRLDLKANNAVAMTVLPSGNIGIGTTAPTALLNTVDATTNTYAATSAALAVPAGNNVYVNNTNATDNKFAGVDFGSVNGAGFTAAAYVGVLSQPTNYNSPMVFGQRTGAAAYSERMRIDASGNIGIGTTSPASTLEVSSTGTSSLFRVTRSDASTTYGMAIYSGGLQIREDSANAARLTIMNTSGNVGVGTTSPARLLHVNGPMRVQPTALPGSPAAGDIAVDSGSSNALKWYDGTVWQTVSTGTGTFSNVTSIADSGGNITLAPAAVTGSVIINSATAATSSTTGALTVTGGAGVSGDIYSGASINAGTSLTVGTNGYIPQLYGSSSASGTIKIDGTSNATKGNVLLASAGGNVGIGTTAPAFSLDVTGTIRSTNIVTVPSVYASSINDQNSNLNSRIDFGNTSKYISFNTNNTPAVRIDSAGNVGIGTTAPNDRLYIVGGGVTSQSVQAIGNPSYWGNGQGIGLSYASGTGSIRAYNNTSGTGTADINFITAGNEQMRVTSAGNVGIGTTAPSSNLHIYKSQTNGSAYEMLTLDSGTYSSTTAGDSISIGFKGNSGAYFGSIGGYGNGSANGMGIWGGSSNASNPNLFVQSGGNVGVGTTAPSAPLTLNTTATTATTIGAKENRLFFLNPSGTVNNGAEVVIGAADTTTGRYAAFGTAIQNNTSGSATGDVYIATKTLISDTALTPRIYVQGAGNVGIGTTSPARLLHVNGPMRVQPAALPGTPAAGDIAVDSGAANALKWYDGSVWQTVSTGSGSFTNVTSISDAGGNITLAPATGTGSVIINSGLAATSSVTGALTVTGGAGVSGDIYSGASINAGTNLTVGTNGYIPQLYGSSLSAGNIKIDGTSHATKGNVLLASAGGNVGIGTTSPIAQLDNESTSTATAGGIYGLANQINVSPASNSTASTVAILNYTSTAGSGSSNISNIQGAYSGALHYGTGAVTSASGSSGVVNNYSSGNITTATGENASVTNRPGATGTITAAYGLNAALTNVAGATIATGTGVKSFTSNAGTMTTNYGFYSSIFNTGTLATSYGVYVGTMNATTNYGLYLAANTGTTNYGVYQTGATNTNYFQGNVGIGTTAPASVLDVAGSFKATESAAAGSHKMELHVNSNGTPENLFSTTATVATYPEFRIEHHQNGTGSGWPIFVLQDGAGTDAAPSGIAANTRVGEIKFQSLVGGGGYGGTQNPNSAYLAGIQASTDTTVDSGRLYFSTAPPGGSPSPTRYLSINGSGFIGMGANTASASAKLHIIGNASSSAWGGLGIGIRQDSGTYTDTSSSGTVASNVVNVLNSPLLAASAATTYTNATTFAIYPPRPSTNTTLTNSSALTVTSTALTGVTNGYGLNVAASTAATNNYAAVFTGGNVGIGTTAPGASLDVKGHIANSGATATIGTCGTSPAIAGNDTRGVITLGTGSPTACTITFASAYASTPICVITPSGGLPGAIQWYVTPSTSALVVNFSATPTASQQFAYHCMQ